jgi:hypothetical protein
VSELLGSDRLDRIIGFNIASCSYITTEMEGEQMMELLKAIKEIMDTNKSWPRTPERDESPDGFPHLLDGCPA